VTIFNSPHLGRAPQYARAAIRLIPIRDIRARPASESRTCFGNSPRRIDLIAGLRLRAARTAVERFYPHPLHQRVICLRPIVHPSAASTLLNIREPAIGNSRCN